MNKREFLRSGLIAGAGALLSRSVIANEISRRSFDDVKSSDPFAEFVQIPLPYSFDALEPHIDAKTMEIHYGKHHAAYTKNLNQLAKDEKAQGKSIEDIFSQMDKYSAGLKNNGGGFYNHNFFWQCLNPKGGGEPTGELLKEINKSFGSFASFKETFSKSASSVFGSGWTWLVKNENGLAVISTPNQDNPLMSTSKEKGKLLLCIDVWEHAYYLKYQNKRADYISAFWNLVDWNFVSSNLLK